MHEPVLCQPPTFNAGLHVFRKAAKGNINKQRQNIDEEKVMERFFPT